MLNASTALSIDPTREKESRVIIGDEVHFYKDKAPFEKSGMSLKGALEFDEDTDKVKCHECGAWCKSIPVHLRWHHDDITSASYKAEHGFNRAAALVTESTRAKQIACGTRNYPKTLGSYKSVVDKQGLIQHAKKAHRIRKGLKRSIESENARNACRPQIMERLRKLAEQVGRTPTSREMHEVGIQLKDLKYHFGSQPKALEMVGLLPRKIGDIQFRWPLHTKSHLTALVKNFYQLHGRSPSYSDMRRGILPTAKVFVRVFKKSFGEILFSLGLPVDRQVLVRKISNKELLCRIKLVAKKIGRPPRSFADKNILKAHRVPVDACLTRFGSWGNTLKKAGLRQVVIRAHRA